MNIPNFFFFLVQIPSQVICFQFFIHIYLDRNNHEHMNFPISYNEKFQAQRNVKDFYCKSPHIKK